jgi:uncharacterized membrane protein
LRETADAAYANGQPYETFSDGAIAVIITVMVLDLRVPVRGVPDVEAMREVLPILVVYALSFAEVGIYWVNHHYLLEKVSQVSHGLLWANLGFLFTLSLIPFGTAWVGERGISSFGLSLYLICCATPAVSWIALSIVVRRYVPRVSGGNSLKQAASLAIYLGVVPVSCYSLTIAIVMLAAVAVPWLIPPTRVCK